MCAYTHILTIPATKNKKSISKNSMSSKRPALCRLLSSINLSPFFYLLLVKVVNKYFGALNFSRIIQLSGNKILMTYILN
jgi:hypothetical protein